MCDDCKRPRNPDQGKEKQAGMQAQSATESYLKYTRWGLRTPEGAEVNLRTKEDVPSYTPLFVQTVLSLYTSPAARESILSFRSDVKSPLGEIIDTLTRAGILTPGPVYFNTAHGVDIQFKYEIDEQALKLYVNRICCVALPEKVWR